MLLSTEKGTLLIKHYQILKRRFWFISVLPFDQLCYIFFKCLYIHVVHENGFMLKFKIFIQKCILREICSNVYSN